MNEEEKCPDLGQVLIEGGNFLHTAKKWWSKTTGKHILIGLLGLIGVDGLFGFPMIGWGAHRANHQNSRYTITHMDSVLTDFKKSNGDAHQSILDSLNAISKRQYMTMAGIEELSDGTGLRARVYKRLHPKENQRPGLFDKNCSPSPAANLGKLDGFRIVQTQDRLTAKGSKGETQ